MAKENISRSTLNVGKLKHRNRNKKGPTLSKVVKQVLEEDFKFLPLARSNAARTYSFLSDRGKKHHDSKIFYSKRSELRKKRLGIDTTN